MLYSLTETRFVSAGLSGILYIRIVIYGSHLNIVQMYEYIVRHKNEIMFEDGVEKAKLIRLNQERTL